MHVRPAYAAKPYGSYRRWGIASASSCSGWTIPTASRRQCERLHFGVLVGLTGTDPYQRSLDVADKLSRNISRAELPTDYPVQPSDTIYVLERFF
jgi:hypothetical protein